MGRGVTRRGLLLCGLAVAGGSLMAGGLDPGRAWAAAGPPIISCAGWGSRAPNDVLPVHDRSPVKILVHHTATPNVANPTRDSAIRLARQIQNFHMDVRRWGDSGQHFTISRGGVVLEGRHHSLEFLRVGHKQVEGAHCTGQNVVALGVENEGTYTAVDPPAKVWERLRELCAYLCSQYGIAPSQIFGHRDFKDTACPGDRLYAALPRLRKEVAALLGRSGKAGKGRKAAIEATPDPGPDPGPTWPLLRIADRGERVLAAQYLLRDAGVAGVVPDGRFTRHLADAVREFQAARGFRDDDSGQFTGMIGGETWPALARPVRAGEGSDAARAVETLLRSRRPESVPDVVTPTVWQHLLAP